MHSLDLVNTYILRIKLYDFKRNKFNKPKPVVLNKKFNLFFLKKLKNVSSTVPLKQLLHVKEIV